MKEPFVIQVDDTDNVLGYIPKLEAHKQGLLHRAVSIFIFNSEGDWLIQKRAEGKYHSGGLWSNTCCSHPYPNEATEDAAIRRLQEEMGLSCDLKKMFSFTYKAELDNDLIEHEIDHLYYGICDDFPKLNPEEVSDWKFIEGKKLATEINNRPENYTEWFKMLFPKVVHELN